MSKVAPRLDKRQTTIFEMLKQISEPKQPTTQGQLAMVADLRGALRNAIKSCPLSRYEIAGQMSHLLGETITKEQIDSWTRQTQKIGGRRIWRHVPAEYLAAFCVVTEDLGPLQVIGKLAGGFVFKGPEAMRVDIQKAEEQIRKLQAEKKKMLSLVREMEK